MCQIVQKDGGLFRLNPLRQRRVKRLYSVTVMGNERLFFIC